MAGRKEIDDVSSAIMYMDTLAMDSMDLHPEVLLNVEAPPVRTGAQSKEVINTDSGAVERAQQGEGDIHETEGPVSTGAQVFDSRGEEETGYDDDEGLMTDPGTPATPEEMFQLDGHEVDETEDMKLDMTENDLEEETGTEDEGLTTDPGTPDTPGTPKEDFPQDGNELDETMDLKLDETGNDLEGRGSDDEALETYPSTPQEEPSEDVNKPSQINDMNVDGADNDLEVLGDCQEEGEKSLHGEKFVAPFPITRVKRIIKLDKDIRLVSSDAIALIAQATALFVQSLGSASLTVMFRTKRKTIRGPDVVLAAKSTRQFRDCLGNDLATLLEESNEDTTVGEDGPVESDHGTGEEPMRKKLEQQKSAKKHQLAPPPGSRPITNFFKA